MKTTTFYSLLLALGVGCAAPALAQPAPPAATFYPDGGYGGQAVGLAPGDYTAAQLAARGIAAHEVSSLTVRRGYRVELYDGDQFRGNTLVVDGEHARLASRFRRQPVNATWDDATASVRVLAASAPATAPFADLLALAPTAALTAPATVDLRVVVGSRSQFLDRVEFYNGPALLGTEGGLLAGAGFNVERGYSWQGVAPGTYTLTAKVYDRAGGATVSAPVTVRVNAAGAQAAGPAAGGYTLWADLAANTLQVLSAAPATIGAVSLRDVSGRLVQSAPGPSGRVNLGNLADGVYFVFIQDQQGAVQKKKILLQH